MTTDDQDDAVLLELAEHRGKLAAIEDRLGKVGRALLHSNAEAATVSETLRGLQGIEQNVADLDARVRNLAARPGASSEGYEPVPTVQWWKISDEEREEAITRLRYWAGRIFVPGYGKLAAMLPPCWDRHEFMLYTLDWLAELWSVLYLTDERTASTVAAQGEFQTRLLSAACEQLATEARECGHQAPAAGETP
jgi:hypothetical protein